MGKFLTFELRKAHKRITNYFRAQTAQHRYGHINMMYGCLENKIKQLASDATISCRPYRWAGSSHGLRLPSHALEIDSLLCFVMNKGSMNLLHCYPKIHMAFQKVHLFPLPLLYVTVCCMKSLDIPFYPIPIPID